MNPTTLHCGIYLSAPSPTQKQLFTNSPSWWSVRNACMQSRTLLLIPCAVILEKGLWCGTESNTFQISRYTASIGSAQLIIWVHISKIAGLYVTIVRQSHVEHCRITDSPLWDVSFGHILLIPIFFILWKSHLLVCNYQYIIFCLSCGFTWCYQLFKQWEVNLKKMTLRAEEESPPLRLLKIGYILSSPGALLGLSLVSFFLTSSVVMLTS